MRITQLFPAHRQNLNDRMRRRMMWIALADLLVTLAGVEAALALMRDMLIAEKRRCCATLPLPLHPCRTVC